ncbi:uncharacterized protein KY384_002740 [Bacidia gigantensis]|uniref:uncharacterized protein n=1 Tax=Bacidia gigantensis TaxID=2732470 RepID=UPI001D05B064|nr:uncharacterized protein KY384_002740 [Bacidia gigantensis]KAG8532862.1 hypothetical protein KY384_002740 [Bacidia gigantensis]
MAGELKWQIETIRLSDGTRRHNRRLPCAKDVSHENENAFTHLCIALILAVLAMKISNHSAIPVYTISGSSTARPLPEWLARKRKRSLKNDPEYANRVELLQDFEFEEASHCIRVSDDGQWVMSTGTYKPQIHTHHLPHLSLSFARHTSSLNTTFTILSSDYTKSLHLQADRLLEFHTPLGCHYNTRLPRYGRDLIYNRLSAEALIPAVGVNENGLGEVFRLSLEAGRFMRAYEVDVSGDDTRVGGHGALQGGVNVGSVNTGAIAEGSHSLLAFGTSLGTVEFWDPRSRGRVGVLQSPKYVDAIDGRQEVTALEFDKSGLGLATGSSTGLIHLYDLRSPHPVLKKDQGYGYPVQNIIYLSSSHSTRSQVAEPKILSADKRIIKIWDAQDGSPWTSVEPAVDMHHVAWCRDSGMLLTANEGRQQHAFFIPQLGPAPKWCSFLDNLVEEMAEDPNDANAFQSQKAGEVYDNYKFLTVQQLESLNLSHLVGTTSLLRPYMHGYFVAQRLYEEAKLIADPFVWEEQRSKRVKEKIDAERESRIRGNKKIAAKVNKRLAEKLMDREERRERNLAKKVLLNGGDEPQPGSENVETKEDKPAKPDNLLADPRFAKLFQDEAFAIDERSREFQMLNPSTKPLSPERTTQDERKLTAVEEEAIDDLRESDSEEGSSESEAPKSKSKPKERISSASYRKSGHLPQQTTMQVSSSKQSARSLQDLSFGSRAAQAKESRSDTHSAAIVGEKEITFAPERKKKKQVVQYEKPNQKRNPDRRSASGNVFRNM